MAIAEEEELTETPLVRLCIEAAAQSQDAVDTWRRQRRTLERLPSLLAEALIRRLLRRGLLYPSLLEVFKYSVEKIDLGGESSVDAEWLAYLGAFHYLSLLNVSDCYRISSSALWPLSGMSGLKELNLSRCSKVTDAGIKHLLSIKTMEKLCISETGVTANGVTLLSSLPNLSTLDLGGLHVTDLAFSSLQVLVKLQYLDLWGSEISNAGAAILLKFPKLNFLNLAWTKVTELPNVSSLKCLNMSNCTIQSVLEGNGSQACLTNLILAGATVINVSEAFSFFETGSLSYLDVSNSVLDSISFLPRMHALEYLDLSGSLVGDDLVEMIASVGANLRFLNLSNTRVSSVGVGILAGNVLNLETLSLSCTPIDDLAILYICMIPSLKVINLRSTKVKGLIHQGGEELVWVPSFTSLLKLNHLERLDLEGNLLLDGALDPISSLKELQYLSLSGHLTDAALFHLSSIPKLINLSMQNAVLTNAGIDSFIPQPTLRVLDLSGCWLLTADVLLSFSQKHPRIEVKHELINSSILHQDDSKSPSPSRQINSRIPKHRKLPPSVLRCENATILDERLKYSREEMLRLQFSSLSMNPPNN